MTSFETRFGEAVDLFEAAVDREAKHLNMFAFAASSGNERMQHVWPAGDVPCDLRSVSKVVVALLVGSLIENSVDFDGGPLSLERPVLPLLAGRVHAAPVSAAWSDVTVKHLLNNTIGHREGFFFRKDLRGIDEGEYLEYVFGQELEFVPGTHFTYSNVGPFLMSVIIQEVLGVSLEEAAKQAVLRPLGLDGAWRKYAGYGAGCTGLEMSNCDLHVLAALLRGRGSHQGVTVVSPDWVGMMSSPLSLTPHMFDSARVFPKYAYGLGLWICQDGSFYCDGTNGQYLIVVPAQDLAIATTGEQPDMKPITRCMVPLLN